jgi:acyl-CoA synthetase (NDP forming)
MNEVMWSGSARGVAFSHVASVGNEAGVTSADLIDYFVEDPATDVILAIIESVRDPQGFVASCSKALGAAKPLVVLKMGLSVKAAHSAATHTGALAGSPAVHEALFRQKGVIQVHDLDELVDMAALFSHAVAPLRARRMERAAIIEISGGGAGLICDTAVAAGVELPELSPEGAEKLQAQLTGIFATNPIDTGGSWGDASKKDIYPACLEAFASEPGIDIVVSRYTIPQSGELGALQDRLRELELARAAHPDRFFPILSRTSVQFSPTWLNAVVEQRLAFLQGYGRGLRALGCLVEYSRAVHGDGATQAAGSRAQPTKAKAAAPALRVLGEADSKALLAAAGIPTIETVRATTADEAVREANRIGYPVVLKVSAVEITHKSDQGGVLLNLTDAEVVKRGFASLREVASKASATFQGVTVQPMAKAGVEVIIGGHRDQQFGPVIAFGLGGIFVEVLRDVALRVAPLSARDASAMLEEVKGKALLDGLRGQPPCDRGAITDALCRLSDLMLARPDITSIDANPAFVYPSGLIVVDARVILT